MYWGGDRPVKRKYRLFLLVLAFGSVAGLIAAFFLVFSTLLSKEQLCKRDPQHAEKTSRIAGSLGQPYISLKKPRANRDEQMIPIPTDYIVR